MVFSRSNPRPAFFTNATIHAESGQRGKRKKTSTELQKDVNLCQNKTNLVLIRSRQKSCEARISVEFVKYSPDMVNRILPRPRTAPCFRNAVMQSTRTGKSQSSQPTVAQSLRYPRHKDPLDDAVDNVLELHMTKRTRLERAASCDLAEVSNRGQGMGSGEIMIKRSVSALALKPCLGRISFEEFRLQHPSSVVSTKAIIHTASGQRNKMKKSRFRLPKVAPNVCRGTANFVRNTLRSKSYEARTSLKLVNGCSAMEDTILQRPSSAPRRPNRPFATNGHMDGKLIIIPALGNPKQNNVKLD